jgi:sec-independent protein translocase protein TatB
MDIFGIGPLELLFIILIALIVVGPREMGEYARSAGRFLNRLYRSDTWRNLTEVSRNLRTLPNRLAREAALEELDAVRNAVDQVRDEVATDVQSLDEELTTWTTPTQETHQSIAEPKPSKEDQTNDEAVSS